MTTQTTTTNAALSRILSQAATAAAKPTTSKTKTPKQCAGGCGQMTKGGQWSPGHDGRVHGRAVQLIRAGATTTEAATAVDCTDDWDLETAMALIIDARKAAEQADEAVA